MEKPNSKLYYSISEVAAMLEVTAPLIRYWESEFPHLEPRKNTKGDRRYKVEDIERLKQVYKLIKIDGYTLRGAKELLSKKKGNKNQEVIEKMKSVREFLVGMSLWIDHQTNNSSLTAKD